MSTDYSVEIGGYSIDLRGHVQRAVELYASDLLNSVDVLTVLFKENFDGKRIKWKDLGLSTDEEQLEFVRLRATLWAYSDWRRSACSEPSMMEFKPLSVLTTMEPVCRHAKALVGLRIPTTERPLLPLESCRVVPCGCDFRLVKADADDRTER